MYDRIYLDLQRGAEAESQLANRREKLLNQDRLRMGSEVVDSARNSTPPPGDDSTRQFTPRYYTPVDLTDEERRRRNQ